jgi:carbon-monoxide dehydrogenase small subunit
VTTYRGTVELTLSVNGEDRRVVLNTADTLLRVLREKLGLTGAKNGCENGDCGACTVLIDGTPCKACMVLAVTCDGRRITTIEGVNGHAVQRAFIEHNGFQCGFCTPGQVLNAVALLERFPDADPATVREWMESNLCRCTGYEGIRKALDSLRPLSP